MATRAVTSSGELTEIADIAGLSVAAPATGPVTQSFGVKSVTGIIHRGIDVSIGSGTPVEAVKDGTVAFTFTQGRDMPGLESDGSPGGYGNQVFLSHGGGITSRYAHFSSVSVVVGQAVRQGDVLGLSGTTGISTGPHLHWELRRDDQPFDPQKYIGAAQASVDRSEDARPRVEEEPGRTASSPDDAADWVRQNLPALKALVAMANQAGLNAFDEASDGEDPQSRGVRRVGRLFDAMTVQADRITAPSVKALAAELSRPVVEEGPEA